MAEWKDKMEKAQSDYWAKKKSGGQKSVDPKRRRPDESREDYKARSEKAAKASRDKLAQTMREKTAEGKRRRYGTKAATTGGGGQARHDAGKSMSQRPGLGRPTKPTKAAAPSAPRAPKAAPKAATTGGGGQARHDAGKGMSERSGVGSSAGGGNSSKGRKLLSKLGKAWRNRDADKGRSDFGVG